MSKQIKTKPKSSLEGGATFEFVYKNIKSFEGLDVLEIGPKHGLHTQLVDSHNPKSITLVELPHKDISWTNKIKSNLTVKRGWFQNMEFDKKYDVIFFAGVIYHNLDQMGMLMKINDLLKDGGLLVFESSTTRNPEYMNKCVIEVHHPKRYKGVPTIKFHPSKKAMRAMAEIAGFEILAEDGRTELRENLLCKKVSEPDFGYEDER